jgi:hypothetical protein
MNLKDLQKVFDCILDCKPKIYCNHLDAYYSQLPEIFKLNIESFNIENLNIEQLNNEVSLCTLCCSLILENLKEKNKEKNKNKVKEKYINIIYSFFRILSRSKCCLDLNTTIIYNCFNELDKHNLLTEHLVYSILQNSLRHYDDYLLDDYILVHNNKYLNMLITKRTKYLVNNSDNIYNILATRDAGRILQNINNSNINDIIISLCSTRNEFLSNSLAELLDKSSLNINKDKIYLMLESCFQYADFNKNLLTCLYFKYLQYFTKSFIEDCLLIACDYSTNVEILKYLFNLTKVNINKSYFNAIIKSRVTYNFKKLDTHDSYYRLLDVDLNLNINSHLNLYKLQLAKINMLLELNYVITYDDLLFAISNKFELKDIKANIIVTDELIQESRKQNFYFNLVDKEFLNKNIINEIVLEKMCLTDNYNVIKKHVMLYKLKLNRQHVDNLILNNNKTILRLLLKEDENILVDKEDLLYYIKKTNNNAKLNNLLDLFNNGKLKEIKIKEKLNDDIAIDRLVTQYLDEDYNLDEDYITVNKTYRNLNKKNIKIIFLDNKKDVSSYVNWSSSYNLSTLYNKYFNDSKLKQSVTLNFIKIQFLEYVYEKNLVFLDNLNDNNDNLNDNNDKLVIDLPNSMKRDLEISLEGYVRLNDIDNLIIRFM